MIDKMLGVTAHNKLIEGVNEENKKINEIKPYDYSPSGKLKPIYYSSKKKLGIVRENIIDLNNFIKDLSTPHIMPIKKRLLPLNSGKNQKYFNNRELNIHESQDFEKLIQSDINIQTDDLESPRINRLKNLMKNLRIINKIYLKTENNDEINKESLCKFKIGKNHSKIRKHLFLSEINVGSQRYIKNKEESHINLFNQITGKEYNYDIQLPSISSCKNYNYKKFVLRDSRKKSHSKNNHCKLDLFAS